jgi:hypothetical protein
MKKTNEVDSQRALCRGKTDIASRGFRVCEGPFVRAASVRYDELLYFFSTRTSRIESRLSPKPSADFQGRPLNGEQKDLYAAARLGTGSQLCIVNCKRSQKLASLSFDSRIVSSVFDILGRWLQTYFSFENAVPIAQRSC